jgi:hypothetical protein
VWLRKAGSRRTAGLATRLGRLYQILMIMTHRDRFWFVSGRKQVAGDAGHR